VIAKVAGCDPIDSALYRYSGAQILQAIKPTLIGISAAARQVVAEFHTVSSPKSEDTARPSAQAPSHLQRPFRDASAGLLSFLSWPVVRLRDPARKLTFAASA